MTGNFTRDYVIELIRSRQKELQDMGVEHLSIFGSAARDELSAESDVDVLVEIKRPMGLFKFVGIQLAMQKILHRSVDLVTQGGLHPRLKDRILEEKLMCSKTARDWRFRIEDMMLAAEEAVVYMQGRFRLQNF